MQSFVINVVNLAIASQAVPKISMVHIWLRRFGATSKKPIRVYSQHRDVLAGIRYPDPSTLLPPIVALGDRYIDSFTGQTKFNGDSQKMKASQSYPDLFGCHVVFT